MKFGKKFLHIILFVLIMFCDKYSFAFSVAVFPADDLNRSYNSLNHTITKYLIGEISQKGVDVIPLSKVYSFMDENRIRNLGYLDSITFLKANNDLHADFVLLSSVCQQNPKSSIGLTVFLVRTTDALTVWSNAQGISFDSEQRLLGISSPKTDKDMLAILSGKIFKDWPKDFGALTHDSSYPAKLTSIPEQSFLHVDSVFFSPKYAKPGVDVKCTVRFTAFGKKDKDLKVFMKVGNKVYLAETEDGIFYETSWVASLDKTINRVKLAMLSPELEIYKHIIKGEIHDSVYPVNLIVDWPSGKREESYIGSYIVDGSKPEVTVKVKGLKLNDKYVFRESLPMYPRFTRREPIKKWEMAILSSSGEKILSDAGKTNLPDYLVWYGNNMKGRKVEKGTYSISLKVWDRAGNVASFVEDVLFLPEAPKVELFLEDMGAGFTANVINNSILPIVSWHMELWTEDNILLQNIRGEKLPERFDLGDDLNPQDKIEFCLIVEDILGGTSKRKIKNIFTVLKKQENGKNKTNEHSSSPTVSSWHDDF